MELHRRALGIAALILLTSTAGCAGSSERLSARPLSRADKIEQVLAAAQPQVEQRFREGPPYTLTVLRGLHAANQSGAEGKDASILWEQEIAARYRANRAQTVQALRAEVTGYSDDTLDDILAILAAKGRRDAPPGELRTNLRDWAFGFTQASRTATLTADCESITSTPRRWAELYPDRPPFTFERFGIDRALLENECVLVAFEARN